ncbi:tetratricopeptide repeat protein, partial [Brachyspira hampsonii]
MKKNIFKKRLLLSLFIFQILVFHAFSQNTAENALKLYNERNYESSIRILESLNVKPSDLDLYLLLIDNYIKLNNFAMAETLIADAERYHSRNYRLLERKLLMELMNNRNSEARTTVNTIKQLDNKNYIANYAEGLLSERAGYYQTAMNMYERARVINRVRPEATVSLAYLYLANGDSNAALKLFNENMTNNPRMAESYYNLANYYYLNKDYNKALGEIDN